MAPIVLVFQNSHFVAGLHLNSTAKLLLPLTNLTRFVTIDLLPIWAQDFLLENQKVKNQKSIKKETIEKQTINDAPKQ